MPPVNIPANAFYRIRAPQNFQPAMREDVQLLLPQRRYVSMTTLIMCCIDALAAGDGNATRAEFIAFVTREFPELCAAFEQHVPGRAGALTLYTEYRNRFVHRRGPHASFAIAEDHEVAGEWVDLVDVEGHDHSLIGLNVDRLAKEFLRC
jgi:hypothetical protein